ncbi:ABC transporter ATP-binding protein [Pararhizobium haloflavum]|uniref:ABC transporter ATP-binding protein n=1 Tax=Pararhizobium haloflavum TaxID=2037914 RepID=UPI001FDFCEA6|nr:ABC transporter ATP-binding protein [Pararhizobium haloflavum]
MFRGATHVIKNVSFNVEEGQIAALIGANGAGKSTTLLTLSGLLRPRSGTAVFRPDAQEVDLTSAPSEKIVRAGLIHCPEGRQIFHSMTVRENLEMGAYAQLDQKLVSKTTAEVLELFPILAERSGGMAGSLSGGEQMMLALGRALLAQPKLLLLDEPSLGLAPLVIERIFDVIAELRRRGVTILLIEQNAAMALDLADTAFVMETGSIVLSGSGADLALNDKVRQSYLGGAA